MMLLGMMQFIEAQGKYRLFYENGFVYTSAAANAHLAHI